nr:MAG TPA: hypothetical protein [Caudoviricetes sp.]
MAHLSPLAPSKGAFYYLRNVKKKLRHAKIIA